MKKPPTPKLVSVVIFTTITIIFWVFLGVYNILMSDDKIEIPPNLLKPIDTQLNTEALKELENKIYIEEGQEIPLKVNITN